MQLIRGCNSVVECQLPKLDVVGSSPITRSSIPDKFRGYKAFPKTGVLLNPKM